jgi:hypothetical protein
MNQKKEFILWKRRKRILKKIENATQNLKIYFLNFHLVKFDSTNISIIWIWIWMAAGVAKTHPKPTPKTRTIPLTNTPIIYITTWPWLVLTRRCQCLRGVSPCRNIWVCVKYAPNITSIGSRGYEVEKSMDEPYENMLGMPIHKLQVCL